MVVFPEDETITLISNRENGALRPRCDLISTEKSFGEVVGAQDAARGNQWPKFKRRPVSATSKHYKRTQE
jgi:hypothetical protein